MKWSTSIGTWAGLFNQKVPMSFSDLMKLLKKLNFDGFELGGFGSHPNPTLLRQMASCYRLPDSGYVELLRAVKTCYEFDGLQCFGFAPDLWAEKLISAEDPTSYYAAFDLNLAFAVGLGIKGIRVDTTQDPWVLGDVAGESISEQVAVVPVLYDLALERVCTRFARCVDEAAKHGITVYWEVEPGFAFNKASQISAVLAGVARPNFKLMADTCHLHHIAELGSRQPGDREVLAGGIVEFIECFGSNIGRFHLIDSDGTINEHKTSTHPPFGQGVLKFDEIMPAIVKAGGGDKVLTIDLCFWPDAPANIATCKQSLDQLIEQYCH